MTLNRVGEQTVKFSKPPIILSTGSVVGPKEGNGPISADFDVIKPDNLLGQKSWEQAEAVMLQEACEVAVKKAGLSMSNIHFLLAGDLLNQLTSANFAARSLNVPFLGLFGACSTMAEALILGAMVIDGGFAQYVLVGSSSHHDAAERQFRFPVEFATHRAPTAQWTATGAGTAVLGSESQGPKITLATVGRVIDMGLKDPNDMGSAMAPAIAHMLPYV